MTRGERVTLARRLDYEPEQRWSEVERPELIPMLKRERYEVRDFISSTDHESEVEEGES